MAEKKKKQAQSQTPAVEETTTNGGTSEKRIYRSQREKVIAGVCGGVAEYFNIDPVLVRIFWVVAAFADGLGLIAYIIAWIIIPENPLAAEQASEAGQEEKKNSGLGFFVGIGMVIIGLLLLADQFHFAYNIWFFRSIDPGVMFALVLIGIGLYFMLVEKKDDTGSGAVSSKARMLRRSVTDRKIAGVCGGLGRYYNIDPTIVRVLFVVLFFNPYLLSAVAYAVMMFAVPEESTEQSG